MGWAFKANTNDSRESPAIYVAEKLLGAGALLQIYDPMVAKERIIEDLKKVIRDKGHQSNIISKWLNRVSIYSDLESAICGSNVLSVITNWEEFEFYNWEIVEQKNIAFFKL